MGVRAELNHEHEYLHVTMEGALDLGDHEGARAGAAAKLEELGWKRLLVDASRIDAAMSIIDHFEFTSSHTVELPAGLRTAIIHDPAEDTTFKFIETVAVNRGKEMKRFTEEAAALAWLLSDT